MNQILQLQNLYVNIYIVITIIIVIIIVIIIIIIIINIIILLLLLISSKAAGSMSAVLVEVGSFVSVSQVFCLFYFSFCERLFFGGTALSGCFMIVTTLFSLILNGRKVFWRAHFARGFLISI